MVKIVTFLCFILCSCSFGQEINVKVSIYYETLCPDSRAFIKEQFWPTYKKLAAVMNVDLVPYGKAIQRDTDGKIICQHGDEECFGNAYHACAIAIFSKEESARFVYCSMVSTNPSSEKTLRECASSIGLSWLSLNTCYESGQAERLILEAGRRTWAVEPPIKSIPTIILNDKYSEANQNMSLKEFQKLTCIVLNQQPQICKDEIEDVFIV